MIAAERKLSEESKAILAKMAGEEISGLRMGENEDISAPFGMVIIDFSDGTSVQLLNTEKSTPFFDEKEDIVGFSCKEYVEETEESTDSSHLKRYDLKKSTIQSVEIVTDKIIASTPSDDYKITFDAGIILHGDKHDYVFSLDKLFFYETILYSTDGNIDEMRPIEEVRKAWLGDEMSNISNVTVERSSFVL